MSLSRREMGDWDWVTVNNPRLLLDYVRGRVSERKRRLFACACCHMVRHLIVDERSWHAVTLAEEYADDLATAAEVDAAAHIANAIHLDMEDRVRRLAAEAAFKSAIIPPEEMWQLDGVWADAALAIEGHALETSCDLGPEEKRQMLDEWCEVWLESLEPVGWTDAHPEEEMAALLRCIVGNPFRPVALDPSWRTGTVLDLARGIYEERAFERLPILADALREAGCENEELLAHCRGPGPHARGCWVVDLVLGKA